MFTSLAEALEAKPGAFAVVQVADGFIAVANAATERTVIDTHANAKTVWFR